MFDRFTDRARRVMGLALKEAQRLDHDCIGSEHILLGLLEEGSCVAASVLKNLEIDATNLLRHVRGLVRRGKRKVKIGQRPLTPGAQECLALALEEAEGLGHMYVGTEHLLLGLLRGDEGVAVQALRTVGVRIEDVRDEILEILGSSTTERDDPPAPVRPVRALTPVAMDVLEEACVQALARRDGAIDASHILLALLGRDDGIAARALGALGIRRETVRAKVLELLGEDGAPPSAE